MPFTSVSIKYFSTSVFDIWGKHGLLLTCGDFKIRKFNSMTIGWGSIGVMWRKPFIQVVVRPTRYTYEFMEKYDSFTVCGFAEKYKKAMQILGTRSGRDGDKITLAGITPISSTKVDAPSYAEAELVLECRKIYWQDFDHYNFLDSGIENMYSKNDYHRIYYGEILEILKQ